MKNELTTESQNDIIAKANAYINSSEYEGTEFGAYLNGAHEYALKWQEAEQKADRYEKSLSRIANQMFDNGVPGCTWGDTEYDSISFVTGYNQALSNVKCIADEALTPKQSTDGNKKI